MVRPRIRLSYFIFACFVGSCFEPPAPAAAQPPASSPTMATSLDADLQEVAFRAISPPRTGVVYNGDVPPNLAGITVAALRLRSGSLDMRGLRAGYFEFSIPTSVLVEPYVERVVLVYQNLGNWSEFFYPPPPGLKYLGPVLGLLPYDAENLSATGLPELALNATAQPITISFANVITPADAKCIQFNLGGTPEFQDLVNGLCSTNQQGHFSIVAKYTPVAAPSPGLAPTIFGLPPSAKANNAGAVSAGWWNWKNEVAVGVVGGVLLLALASVLVLSVVNQRRNRRFREMEWRADAGETLEVTPVRRSAALVASVSRTKPSIENEYAV